MSIFSALKTIAKTGDDLIIPKEIKQEITRIENLGGKLDVMNASNLADKGLTLTDSQIEKLYKREKENNNIDEFDESTYNAWNKYREESPKVAQRKAKELTQSILTQILTRVAKQNSKDNLDFYKQNTKDINPRERKSFIETYELRPAFPKGFEDAVRQEPVPNLQNLVKRTEDMKTQTKSQKVISQNDNVTTVNFRTLKKK